MIANRFEQGMNTIPLISPVDVAAVATASPFLALKGVNEGTLYVFFGTISAASADQAVTVTVEAATAAASGSEAAIAFQYRLSGAVGANTFGTITAATTAGATIATTDDDKLLAIDINPAAIANALADASHIRVVVTPDAGATATEIAAWAQVVPAYAQATMKSAT